MDPRSISFLHRSASSFISEFPSEVKEVGESQIHFDKLRRSCSSQQAEENVFKEPYNQEKEARDPSEKILIQAKPFFQDKKNVKREIERLLQEQKEGKNPLSKKEIYENPERAVQIIYLRTLQMFEYGDTGWLTKNWKDKEFKEKIESMQKDLLQGKEISKLRYADHLQRILLQLETIERLHGLEPVVLACQNFIYEGNPVEMKKFPRVELGQIEGRVEEARVPTLFPKFLDGEAALQKTFEGESFSQVCESMGKDLDPTEIRASGQVDHANLFLKRIEAKLINRANPPKDLLLQVQNLWRKNNEIDIQKESNRPKTCWNPFRWLSYCFHSSKLQKSCKEEIEFVKQGIAEIIPGIQTLRWEGSDSQEIQLEIATYRKGVSSWTNAIGNLFQPIFARIAISNVKRLVQERCLDRLMQPKIIFFIMKDADAFLNKAKSLQKNQINDLKNPIELSQNRDQKKRALAEKLARLLMPKFSWVRSTIREEIEENHLNGLLGQLFQGLYHPKFALMQQVLEQHLSHPLLLQKGSEQEEGNLESRRLSLEIGLIEFLDKTLDRITGEEPSQKESEVEEASKKWPSDEHEQQEAFIAFGDAFIKDHVTLPTLVKIVTIFNKPVVSGLLLKDLNPQSPGLAKQLAIEELDRLRWRDQFQYPFFIAKRHIEEGEYLGAQVCFENSPYYTDIKLAERLLKALKAVKEHNKYSSKKQELLSLLSDRDINLLLEGEDRRLQILREQIRAGGGLSEETLRSCEDLLIEGIETLDQKWKFTFGRKLLGGGEIFSSDLKKWKEMSVKELAETIEEFTSDQLKLKNLLQGMWFMKEKASPKEFVISQCKQAFDLFAEWVRKA